MAITHIELAIFTALRRGNALPPRPAVLELGESNWYGDVAVEWVRQSITQFVTDAELRTRLLADFVAAVTTQSADVRYKIAKIVFRALLDYSTLSAIDPGTAGSEYRFDLNYPVPLDRQFDLTLNIGTSEHIFNIGQFYKTMHELTRPNGLMITTAPFTGWIDHGFYNLQATFYFDLAIANRYNILLLFIGTISPPSIISVRGRDEVVTLAQEGKIPQNAELSVVFRKPPDEAAFTMPTQGIYAGTLSPVGREAWRTLR
jgi:hypothetical protein